MALSFEIQNEKIQAWADDTIKLIRLKAASYGIDHVTRSPSGSPSVLKIKSKLLFTDGSVRAVSFRFPRSLIYPHRGAGKGQGGKKGSRWITQYGVRKKTNPASLNKMNTGKRKAKPFFNDVLEIRVPALADIVAVTGADIVTGKLFIK